MLINAAKRSKFTTNRFFHNTEGRSLKTNNPQLTVTNMHFVHTKCDHNLKLHQYKTRENMLTKYQVCRESGIFVAKATKQEPALWIFNSVARL